MFSGFTKNLPSLPPWLGGSKPTEGGESNPVVSESKEKKEEEEKKRSEGRKGKGGRKKKKRKRKGKKEEEKEKEKTAQSPITSEKGKPGTSTETDTPNIETILRWIPSESDLQGQELKDAWKDAYQLVKDTLTIQQP